MATLKSVGDNRAKFMPGDGRGLSLTDKVALTANPAVNDVLTYLIPAGVEVTGVEIQCDDIDTNGTPTLAFSVGYAPAAIEPTLVAAPAYFAAAGQTTGRTGGRLICSFKPIWFKEDVFLTITIGATAATFAAGEIHVMVNGSSRGVM